MVDVMGIGIGIGMGLVVGLLSVLVALAQGAVAASTSPRSAVSTMPPSLLAAVFVTE